jgi:hypothetical protein
MIANTMPFPIKDFTNEFVKLIKIPKSLVPWVIDYGVKEKIIKVAGDDLIAP